MECNDTDVWNTFTLIKELELHNSIIRLRSVFYISNLLSWMKQMSMQEAANSLQVLFSLMRCLSEGVLISFITSQPFKLPFALLHQLHL